MSDAVLKWANRVTRGHDHIIPAYDYEESWADGLTFCALFYAYFPDKIPIKTLKADTNEDKINNLALAFKVGSEAGIEPLLDPDDTMLVHEKKSIMLYLSEVYNGLKEYSIKFQASAAWNKKYEDEEKQRKFSEWKAQKEAEARGEIYTPPKRTGSRLQTLGDSQKSEEQNVTKNVPEKPSTPVKAAPEPSSVGLTYEVSGRGKDGGNEGRMLIFTVTVKNDGKAIGNPIKEDLVVHLECPGTAPRLNIMVSGGCYHIGFTPLVGGQHWFDFVWKGTWLNESFMLPIKNKLNKVPDHPYTGTERKAAGATTSPTKSTSPSTKPVATTVAKEPSAEHSICSNRVAELPDNGSGSFNITCKDSTGDVLKGDFKFDVKINGPSSVKSNLTNNGDGTYICNFGPLSCGDYRVEVSYKGKVIHNGSWNVKAVEEIANIKVEDLTILFHACDKYGTPKASGGELDKFKVEASGASNEDVEIFDLDDGRYTLEYHVIPGVNRINVLYNGKSVSGFPINFDVSV